MGLWLNAGRISKPETEPCMSTFHVVPRLMVFSKFSGNEFSDDDLVDVGNDNSYKPDKGKGDKLKLPDRSSHCGTCQSRSAIWNVHISTGGRGGSSGGSSDRNSGGDLDSNDDNNGMIVLNSFQAIRRKFCIVFANLVVKSFNIGRCVRS